MQELLIYLFKSSGLLIAFFLAYHFLLRKETFFKSNRWFLLIGLFTSTVLPLLFIKKFIWVETPKQILKPTMEVISNIISTSEPMETSTAIDWFQVGFVIYALIALLLLLKICFNLISLFKVLDNKKVIKKEKFQYIDVNENLSPFSFFNYIVYNSSLYSKAELESILLHEKIHSAQKHSFDVLLTNLVSVIFWFNPFMNLYKRAVTQNLEYIADSEAIAQIDDKKTYQMALLKVVSHQSCLPITNHFYQSLIKKRIVMLNKNQSNKRNSWKYAAILPALVAFVILFQVRVIAQERKVEKQEKIADSVVLSDVFWYTDKNTTDSEMQKDVEELKKEGVNYKFSNVKRNAKNEITAIKVEFSDKFGNKGITELNGKNAIEPIYFSNTKGSVGFKKDLLKGFVINEEMTKKISSEVRVKRIDVFDDYPKPPTPPIAPQAPQIDIKVAKFPNIPQPPKAPTSSPLNNKKEWDKFEKKMAEFEKKMEAIQPEMDAYAEKMSTIDDQMKPFEKEMELFEKEMEEYSKKLEENQIKKKKD